MMPKKTVHLVWNPAKSECVGFLDQGDADYTATGDRQFLLKAAKSRGYMSTPSLGDEFRDAYGEDADRLPQSKVVVDGQ